jgi:hypothetical protein
MKLIIASTLFLTLAAAQGLICGYGIFRNELCCNFDVTTGRAANCEERKC